MSRHIWRACDRAAGFTMVELLVTIIIAGVFFAAMIPFLASAQEKTAGDNMRNIAMQLARDKIEKVRQLDYDSVTTAYLNANGPPNATGQFGTQWTARTGNGGQKLFYVRYGVTSVAATATSAAYRVVSVSVSWQGPPLPNYTTTSGATPVPAANTPITLVTQVSQQYYGPQIVDLMSPDASSGGGTDPVDQINAGGNVRLLATVATADISQMQGTPAGKVDFTVSDANGNKVGSGSVSAPTTTGGNQYQWTWDSRSASTGYYIFTATATSSTLSTGNTWSIMYYLQASGLPAPLLTGVRGDQTANLSWTAVTGADHYQVLRSTTSGAETVLVSNVASTTYLNTGLTNGTTYYYEVRAVGADGTLGALSLEVPVTPVLGADSTPPTDPTNLVVGGATDSSLVLTWTASTDPPPPTTPSGVVQYTIYRSTTSNGTYTQVGTVSGTQAVPPVTTFTDHGADLGGALAKNTTYWYKVNAMDGSNNVSTGFAGPASGTTLAASTTGTLAITNGNNGQKTISVTVYNVTTQQYYTTGGAPSSGATSTSIAVGVTTNWSPLPTTGTYTVTATGSNNKTSTQSPITITANGTTTITFSGF